ncbi:MAG: hypothetical protein KA004_17760 [Verrucomicrobiales bacterium]|nr:hypothetical protein [Verrucomicrobiales bacterium]
MTPEEQVQRLLRLKRHERPPEDLCERVLEEFHRRQHREASRRGVFAGFGERIGEILTTLRRPVLGWSAAGACAALAVFLATRPGEVTGQAQTPAVTQQSSEKRAPVTIAPPVSREVVPVALTPENPPPDGELKKVLTPEEARKIIGPPEPESVPPAADPQQP